MADASAWSRTPPAARAGWASRPRFAPSDFPVLLWRERWLMLLVFLAIAGAGVAGSLLLKPKYTAGAEVLVRAGEEYAYEPLTGDGNRGTTPDANQMVQSEATILQSEELRRRVVAKLGISKIDPELAQKYAQADAAGKEVIMAKAVRGLGASLTVATQPQNPVVGVAFEGKDPVLAAQILNTLLEEYLVYRRTVLAGLDTPALGRQRDILAARLAKADDAYRQFLIDNGVGDFEAEKTSLAQLQAALEQKSYDNQAALESRLGRLADMGGQLQAVAPEVGLYRDTNPAGAQKLLELRMQRASLLSRYKPDAQPVRQLDAEIARMEAAVQGGQTTGDGPMRVGINPVFQTLQTENIQLQAEVAALRQAQAALDSQLAEVRARNVKMASLEPQYQALYRDRDVIQTTLRALSLRAQEAEAARGVAEEGAQSVRIVARATPPTQGSSLRKPVAILAVLFGGFSALCAGLARMFLRPGLPTRAAAARTLELPVLGSARAKIA